MLKHTRTWLPTARNWPSLTAGEGIRQQLEVSPGISQSNHCQCSVSDYLSTNFHALKCFILVRKKAQVSASFLHYFSFLCWHTHHMEKRRTSLVWFLKNSSLEFLPWFSVSLRNNPFPTAAAEHQTPLKWYDITVPVQCWLDVERQHSLFVDLQLSLFLLLLFSSSQILFVAVHRKKMWAK